MNFLHLKIACALILISITTLSLEAREPRLFSLEDFPSLTESERIVYFQKDTPLSGRETELIEHVKNSIAKSKKETSQIDQHVLNIDGMSSPRGRHLINNLCSLPHARYLEIGCWKGSTFIAALYRNQTSIDYAIGIDNWSQFGGPFQEFQNNCGRLLPQDSYQFYSGDCFAIDPHTLVTEPINIYFYDGDHSALAQELAFTHYNEILDNVFIAIVDDWSVESVQEGTLKAFKQLGYEILFEADLVGRRKPHLFWWNGMYVAVIRKVNA